MLCDFAAIILYVYHNNGIESSYFFPHFDFFFFFWLYFLLSHGWYDNNNCVVITKKKRIMLLKSETIIAIPIDITKNLVNFHFSSRFPLASNHLFVHSFATNRIVARWWRRKRISLRLFSFQFPFHLVCWLKASFLFFSKRLCNLSAIRSISTCTFKFCILVQTFFFFLSFLQRHFL